MATKYPQAIDDLDSLPDVGTGLDQPLLLSNRLLRDAIIAVENQLGVQQGSQTNIIGVLGNLANQVQTLNTNLATLTTLVNKVITLNNLKTS